MRYCNNGWLVGWLAQSVRLTFTLTREELGNKNLGLRGSWNGLK